MTSSLIRLVLFCGVFGRFYDTLNLEYRISTNLPHLNNWSNVEFKLVILVFAHFTAWASTPPCQLPPVNPPDERGGAWTGSAYCSKTEFHTKAGYDSLYLAWPSCGHFVFQLWYHWYGNFKVWMVLSSIYFNGTEFVHHRSIAILPFIVITDPIHRCYVQLISSLIIMEKKSPASVSQKR